MSETKYTVFFAQGSFLTSGNGGRYELQELIDWGTDDIDHAVAWAADLVRSYGGSKEMEELRAESIAAGRLIELVDGRYVARGVTSDTLECPAFYDALKAVYEDKLEAAYVCRCGTASMCERCWSEAVAPVYRQQPKVDPNAAMIARDGPAKPVIFGVDWAAGCGPATPSTAKPPMPALTRMSAGDHRFGLGRSFG